MIKTAKEARHLFDHGSKTVDEVLELIERAARRNSRYVQFDGWPSDEVVGELKLRGFSVTLSEVLSPSTKIFW
jgi:hypothetical protein